MFDAELESFKKTIDLRQYAAAQGYHLDGKISSKRVSMMRHLSTDDKIAVKRNLNGHYVYCSNRDGDDNGSIVDFVQNRQRISLGAVRKELRPWIGQPPILVPVFPDLHKSKRDHAKVELAYSLTRPVVRHTYLESERALPASLLNSPRFAGRIRLDDRGNAIFPHEDAEGICGFEIKNKNFTGFSPGGTKGLFLSNQFPDDRRIVFGESGIDVASHAVLFADPLARYGAIGGKPNPEQPELIKAAVARMPEDSETVSAMDADADGRQLAEMVRQIVQSMGRRFVLQEPFGFKDWNDQLRKRPQLLSSYRPEVPTVA